MRILIRRKKRICITRFDKIIWDDYYYLFFFFSFFLRIKRNDQIFDVQKLKNTCERSRQLHSQAISYLSFNVTSIWSGTVVKTLWERDFSVSTLLCLTTYRSIKYCDRRPVPFNKLWFFFFSNTLSMVFGEVFFRLLHSGNSSISQTNVLININYNNDQ